MIVFCGTSGPFGVVGESLINLSLIWSKFELFFQASNGETFGEAIDFVRWEGKWKYIPNVSRNRRSVGDPGSAESSTQAMWVRLF